MNVEIKICGINDEQSAIASIGAEYVGFVFYKNSVRYVSEPNVKNLMSYLNKDQKTVGLFVNSKIEEIVRISENLDLDFIQLHGEENVKFIKELKKASNKKIIKAIPVKTIEDIKISEEFKNLCDMILFDTKTSSSHFGGTGKTFNWELLKNFKFTKKWMIAGGINIGNIEKAIQVSNPGVVDISSGVEKSLGVKCKKKIREIIKYVKKV